MSDEPGKPDGSGGDGARRRRRRRRKPGGGKAEGAPAAKSDRAPATGGARNGSAKDEGKPGRKRRTRRRGSGEDAPARGIRKPRGEQKPRRGGRGRGGSSRATDAPPAPGASAVAKPTVEGWSLTPPPPAHADVDADAPPDDSAILAPGDAPWGDDSAAETPDIQLAPNLPADAAANVLDPVTAPLAGEPGGYEGSLSARIANVVAVRFVPAGRLYLYDAGDEILEPGDAILVEGEHGKRVAIVSTASIRKPPRRSLKRILRRATADDQHPASPDECREHLQTAKALAKKQGLQIKVFRAQFDAPNNLSIYYSCDQKTDVRGLSRALSKAIPVRVDLRHTGARDEAKMVGGIGSCGQELCCTTWLPAFVPVSIKNAKEQGLVLNPTKVSGQCGRLKCCLVYEQALYSEMRKGLPKLGKRVTTNDGHEGRVIEVDVLHQRIRVGIGRGESKVYGKGEVEPLFASQPQSQNKSKKRKQAPAPAEGAPEPAGLDAKKEPRHDQD